MKTLILFTILMGLVFTSPLGEESCLYKTCTCDAESPNSINDYDLLPNEEVVYGYDITCRVDDGAIFGVFPERISLPNYKQIKISVFDLQSLGFKTIPDRAFADLNIQYLDLSTNELTMVKNNTFAGVTGKLAIDLSSNKIEFIEDDAFNHNTFELLTLKLEKNNLGKIEPERISHLLKNLKSLTTLLLTENGLTQMPDIEHLTQLRQVSLAKNQIEHLNKFPYSITDLNLDHNRIKSLESNTFSNLKTLKYLSLDSNQISYIDPNAFANQIELIILNLARNYIKHLPERFIFNLINLDRLDLSSQNQMLNNISAFAFDRISNQNFIKNIDLRGNRLNDFSPKAFCSRNKSNHYINVGDLVLPHNMETEVNACWFVQLARGFNSMYEYRKIQQTVHFQRIRYIDHVDGQVKCNCEFEKARLFLKLDGNCHMDNGDLVPLNSYSCKGNFNKEQIEEKCDSMPDFDCTEAFVQTTTTVRTTQQVEKEPETEMEKQPQNLQENEIKEEEKPEVKTTEKPSKVDESKNQNEKLNIAPTKQTLITSESNRILNNNLLVVVSLVLASLYL